jgi:hypothetical protein
MPRVLRSPRSKSFRLENVSVPNADVARCERRRHPWRPETKSAWGQSRRFDRVQPTSGLTPQADIIADRRHVSKVPRGDMASHLQMKRSRLSWRPLFPYWSLLGPVFVRRWRDTSRTRRRPRPRRPPRRRATATRNRIPLNQKRLCVDLVHEDEWELDGTVRILTHKQPLRAGFAERTLATSSRTYGGCRPCHGSSKLRSRNEQPKPPP